ncbi:hypothetical protein AN936_13755 [Sphingopyxis macrogoltabida]|uniref:Uncharacterized protein n=1 Tax=Sphingopyxis macrogoltabida TaxID=33050 RepID=A0A0N9U7Y0_SPHMC|nr:hypothetical protein AN936_13755 [Sphingopyxis macrogoltabida]
MRFGTLSYNIRRIYRLGMMPDRAPPALPHRIVTPAAQLGQKDDFSVKSRSI